MNKVLIAGVESVVGGNLAISLARSQSVFGIALSQSVKFSGCEIEFAGSNLNIPQLLDRVKPQRVIYCGRGSQTGWEGMSEPGEADVQLATSWIDATRQAEAHLTLVSSAAIFTGPWMFHAENSQSHCSTSAAAQLRAIENYAAENCPGSLIIRSHAFGWQPGGAIGWIETLLERLQHGQTAGLDCFRHGSPILASELADILSRAWTAGLSGVYHIAGAERANPVQFARRLAHYFQLPIPSGQTGECLIDRPAGFGCGETSLQTRKIRRALHISLPMLEDGVQRLFQQHADGYRTRLTGHSAVPGTKVA